MDSALLTLRRNYRQAMKPRLARKASAAARINLNRFWNEMEEFYNRYGDRKAKATAVVQDGREVLPLLPAYTTDTFDHDRETAENDLNERLEASGLTPSQSGSFCDCFCCSPITGHSWRSELEARDTDESGLSSLSHSEDDDEGNDCHHRKPQVPQLLPGYPTNTFDFDQKLMENYSDERLEVNGLAAFRTGSCCDCCCNSHGHSLRSEGEARDSDESGLSSLSPSEDEDDDEVFYGLVDQGSLPKTLTPRPPRDLMELMRMLAVHDK